MPTPTPSTSTVPTMRVAVEVAFVRACADCRSIATQAATAAIADASVTSLRLVPSGKHACGRVSDPKMPFQPSAPLPGQQSLLEHASDADTLAMSDTNGTIPPDFDGPTPGMFSEAELTAMRSRETHYQQEVA